ncbi:MAG TPA: PqqD family protein [Methylomirabilota bacterium]|nr:PqqD family protein [Methylomirabilota bacterium]
MAGESPNPSGKAPTISLDDTVSASPDVIFRELDGQLVLLDLATASYFGLNDVGLRFWTLIQADGSLARAFTVLRGEYRVAPKELERDLLRLVDELSERGLVRVVTHP